MIGVVLFTHGSVASALRDTAETILGPLPGFGAVDLPADSDRETAWAALDGAVRAVDKGDGVLLLVDMFGGTPSNLALARLAEQDAEVLTGVNLAMVLRAARKRAELPLASLAQDVLAYGRRNVTAS
ncbi:MAG: PTS sugar transporter subunit IIA, partial [Myxococcota bacterium]|nr:PTS sugar transporter subunit IIA [Myxococcota bacterium]